MAISLHPEDCGTHGVGGRWFFDVEAFLATSSKNKSPRMTQDGCGNIMVAAMVIMVVGSSLLVVVGAWRLAQFAKVRLTGLHRPTTLSVLTDSPKWASPEDSPKWASPERVLSES